MLYRIIGRIPVAKFFIFASIIFIVTQLIVFDEMEGKDFYFCGSAYGNIKTYNITWGHAVNSAQKLDETLRKGLMMLEADIMYNEADGDVYMAHPPDIPPDALTFAQWLRRVIARADLIANERKAAEALPGAIDIVDKPCLFGIKLDFKHPKAVGPVLEELDKLRKRVKEQRERGDRPKQTGDWDGEIGMPLWMNADVLQGPGGWASAFDKDQFVRECHSAFPCATLSLGMTTGQVFDIGYSSAMVDEMISLCQRHNLTGDKITFALKGIAVELGWEHIARLLNTIEGSTLTLWGPTHDSFLRSVLSNSSTHSASVFSALSSPSSLSSSASTSTSFSTLPPLPDRIFVDTYTLSE